MPFIHGLMEGTLDPEKFKHYISQDSHYLEHFGRTLSLVAAPVPPERSRAAVYPLFGEGAIVVESAPFMQDTLHSLALPKDHHYHRHATTTIVFGEYSCTGTERKYP